MSKFFATRTGSELVSTINKTSVTARTESTWMIS